MRDFCIEDGKTIVFFHDSCGQAHSLCGYSIFPSICRDARFYDNSDDETREVHRAETASLIYSFTDARKSFRGGKYLTPGPDGTVEAIDSESRPLLITGSVGKGKCIFCGLLIGDILEGWDIYTDADFSFEQEIITETLTWIEGYKEYDL